MSVRWLEILLEKSNLNTARPECSQISETISTRSIYTFM